MAYDLSGDEGDELVDLDDPRAIGIDLLEYFGHLCLGVAEPQSVEQRSELLLVDSPGVVNVEYLECLTEHIDLVGR
jgi:hypothetical protein